MFLCASCSVLFQHVNSVRGLSMIQFWFHVADVYATIDVSKLSEC